MSRTEHAPAQLEVENLVVEYASRGARDPVRVLHGVDFSVAAGTTLAVVGESGCGKTTLARALVRLVPMTSGRIRFEGEDITELRGAALSRHRQDLQMIFQDPYGSLDPRMSAAQIIAEGLPRQPRRRRGEVRELVAELMRKVGLDPEAADRRPGEFSGGQRQRIGIARALAASPRVLVCDEATSALDVSVQAQVLELLGSLRDDLGMTNLFISHNLGVVRQTSDTVAVMYLGRIVEIGPTEQIFTNPRHPYTKALIVSVPDPVAAGPIKPRRALLAGELPSPAAPPSGCAFRTRCPLAIEKCREELPPLEIVGDAHRAACWRADEVGAWSPRPTTAAVPSADGPAA